MTPPDSLLHYRWREGDKGAGEFPLLINGTPALITRHLAAKACPGTQFPPVTNPLARRSATTLLCPATTSDNVAVLIIHNIQPEPQIIPSCFAD